MIVCICRALNEKKINQSIDEGATTARQVYCSLGVKPKCGKCCREIQEMIDSALSTRLQTLPNLSSESSIEQRI
ncbi:MAG: (2Fe-2S)-binding protein [Myxococcales bacterium]|nr:(2Fe-2S)-binding protein [Myxococcales bacterium]MCB9643656.1 (2Fe-2S)-binding protein [Myxococcales bacterium]